MLPEVRGNGCLEPMREGKGQRARFHLLGEERGPESQWPHACWPLSFQECEKKGHLLKRKDIEKRA